MSTTRHLDRTAMCAGVQVRVRAAWAREDLDHRLAEDADPDSDALLRGRAQRLLTPAAAPPSPPAWNVSAPP